MSELLIAGLVFIAAHVAPAATGFRGWAMERFGRTPYLTGYSILSIGLLAWVVSAALRAPYIELWPPSAHGSFAALLCMAIACWLAVGGFRRPNPASVALRSGAAPLDDPGPLALTRHPIMWAFGLWALGHVAANGDLAAVLMFGVSALFAVIGARVLDRRAARNGVVSPPPSGTMLQRLRRAFGGTGWRDVVIGGVVWGLLLFLHPVIIGADPLALVE